MTPAVTIDLRGFDFETQAELKRLVHELIPAIRDDYPMVAIHGVVISEQQLKWLRLERFMECGLTNEQARQETIVRVDGWAVTVVPEGEPIRCAGCGGIHDQDQPWYHKA